jgi:hypothetical protein
MYLHEAQRQDDGPKFKQAMMEEVQAHEDNGQWILVDRNTTPTKPTILPSRGP